MLQQMLNPTPTFYKWDRFWVGFLPAIAVPIASFFIFFGLTYFLSVYVNKTSYSLHLFLYSMKNSTTFLRTTTLCCIPNAALFFFLINRSYYNASRAVVLTTMIFIILIVAKELL